MSLIIPTFPTISLWQPWAAALVTENPYYLGTAIKLWETRIWKIPEKYIGKRVLVHAALKDDAENKPFIYRVPFYQYQSELQKSMQYGAIIGSVILDSYITTEEWLQTYNTGRATEEVMLGDYTAGRYAWKLSGHVRFYERINIRGYQKIYGTPQSIIPLHYHSLFQ